MKQGWEIKKLGDVATILDNQRKPVTKKDRCNGIYPYYGASGVQDYVDKYIFDGRYLLVGEDGAKWGASDKSAYIVDGKCWVNNHAHILKLDNSINDKMVEYYLVYKDLSEYITGAIVPKLTQQALKQIPIPVPERAEQERIVGELDCLSGIIAAKRAQLRELDTLAQSIFYTMFGDPITNDKGWQTKKWEDLLTIVNGKNQKKVICENGKYPIYGSGGIMGWANDYLCPQNTVIIGRKGNINKPLFVKEKFWNVDTAFGLVANKEILIPYFLFFFCQMYNFEQHNKAVTIPSLTKSDLLNIQMPCPDIDLQTQFAEKIEHIEEQKQLIKASIAETEDLFNSRMSYYFN